MIETEPDLFELGRTHFEAFVAEFASYGLQADPGLELRPGSGLLCYYSLDDRQIYLAVPALNQPEGKLQALFLRSILGCRDKAELLRFFQLFIPHVIAHELAHHYRHRYGLFGASLWQEEQIANKLAAAVVKHRLSPADKAEARRLLAQAIDALSARMQEKNIAVDSYYSVLHALNASGQIGVADFENLELIQTMFSVDPEQLLKGSGQLSDELEARLDERDELIDEIDRRYASDQLKYIYYHVGWLSLDLNSRETEYIDEFARHYLNLGVELLPAVVVPAEPADEAIRACFQAYRDTQPHSEVAGRYFYRRYRSLLLASFDQEGGGEGLKRQAAVVLERWGDQAADTLNYLVQLAPPALRPLFPHLIAGSLAEPPPLPAALPTETDRRLWEHALRPDGDIAAANTLYRLELLDRAELYRPLPAELLLELVHGFYQVYFAPGETVIWEGDYNDDVFVLLEGKLEVSIVRAGQVFPVGQINPGEMFGEIAFFTEDPRYATVRAVEPSRCFVLKDNHLQLFAFRHPVMLMQMAGILAKRLADLYKTSRRETV